MKSKHLLLALLAAGLSLGSLQAQEAPKEKPPGAPQRPGLTFDSVSKHLELTDEQKTQVKPILENWQTKAAEIRKDKDAAPEDRRAKMKALRDDTSAKLKPILTAEQYAKWEKMGPGARRGGTAGAPGDAPEGKKHGKKAE